MQPSNPAMKPMADDLVAHVTGGASSDEPLWARHYHDDFESVESDGTSHRGIEQVRQKHAWFAANFKAYGAEAGDVFYGASGFAVVFTMELEANDGSMPRGPIRELAVYTVRGGKIVREEFFQLPG